jgi:hypothetical protein
MSRQTILGLALGLTVLASSALHAESHAITGSEKGRLLARDGKVWLARSGHPGPFKGWGLTGRGGTGSIGVVSRDKWDGCYLAFDPGGKDPRLTLVSRPGAGTEWKRAHVKGTAASYTLQATRGKYKGWYLGAGEEVKRNGKVIGRRAVLIEKPEKPLLFSIYEIGG